MTKLTEILPNQYKQFLPLQLHLLEGRQLTPNSKKKLIKVHVYNTTKYRVHGHHKPISKIVNLTKLDFSHFEY